MKKTLFALFAAAALLAAGTPARAGVWNPKATMFNPREHSAAVTLGGRIYLLGGFYYDGGASHYYDLNHIYDPAADTISGQPWSTTTVMNTGRDGPAVAALRDSFIYAFGGYDGSSYSNTFEKFYRYGQYWQTLSATMNVGRRFAQAVELGGYIYVMGGEDYSNTWASMERLNPATNLLTTRMPMTNNRKAFYAAAVGGKIYAIGGQDNSANTLSSVEEYTPDAGMGTWVDRTPLPGGRAMMSGAVIANKIYIYGGVDSTGYYPPAVYVYDPAMDSWDSLEGVMNTPRVYMGGAASNNRLYAFGGHDFMNDPASYTMVDEFTFSGPQITWTAPYHNATGIQVGDQVVVAFNTAMDTMGGMMYTCTPDPMGWVVHWSSTGDTAYFDHGPFAGGTQYSFQITSAFDASYQPLIPGALPNPWTFTTLSSDPYEPNDNSAVAFQMYYGDSLTGAGIDPDSDYDWFKFTGNPGEFIQITCYAQGTLPGSTLDSYIHLYDPSITEIASNDDWQYPAFGRSSRLSFTLSQTGVHYIRVHKYNYKGKPGNVTGKGASDVYHLVLKQLPHPLGGWVARYPMLNPHGGVGSTVPLFNDKVYLFAVSGSNSSQMYDPGVDSWTPVQNPPTARSHGASVKLNDELLFLGGISGGVTLATVERFRQYDNYPAGMWYSSTPMNHARREFGVANNNGLIYVIGGHDGTAVTGTVEERASSGLWSYREPMPTPRQMMAVVSDDWSSNIYCIGGVDSSWYMQSKVEVYNTYTNTWDTSRTPLPLPMYGMSAAWSNGKIYVAGGYDYLGNPSAKAYVYEPSANAWTTIEDLPTARAQAAAVEYQSNIYVMGGNDNAKAELTSTEAFITRPQAVFPPHNGAVNQNPVLNWLRVPYDNSSRVVWGYNTSGQPELINRVVTDQDTIVLASFPDSVYFWRVRSYNAGYSDSTGWSQTFTYRLDRVPPPPVTGLTADGSNPSPWSTSSIFEVYIDTNGLSDVRGGYYKIGSPPTDSSDHANIVQSVPFAVDAAAYGEGVCSLYVWLYDAAGNSAWQQPRSVALRWDATCPTVEVVTPNGSESWQAGTTHSIVWHPWDNTGVKNDSIYYSSDGGANWNLVRGKQYAPGTPADTILGWNVPNNPSSDCYVKVVLVDPAGNRVEDLSNYAFAITAAAGSVLAVSINTWDATAAGGGTSVDVSNSGNSSVISFTVSSDSSWLGYSPGSGGTPASVNITAEANTSGAARTGHIIVSATALGQQQVITVTQPFQDAQAPTVTINTPNGGEVWPAGAMKNITWSQGDNVGVVRDSILLSTDNGVTWTLQWVGGPATVYNWNVPITPSANCVIRVYAIDAAGNAGGDISNAIFTIADSTAPSVTVTAPNGGEAWSAQSFQFVTWDQNDNVAVTTDSIFFSTNGGGTWSVLYGGPAATASGWVLPDAHSSQCRIRIKAIDAAGNSATDLSDANFTINDTIPPAVTVVAPNGGETFGIGVAINVNWTQSDNVRISRDSLYYSVNGGSAWLPVAQVIPGTSGAQVYSWVVPNNPSANCRFRVVAIDTAGNKTQDASDNTFTIATASSPSISVNPTTLNVASGSGSDSITVTNTGNTAVINYTVTYDSLWMSVNPNSGSTPGKFGINWANNNSGVARTGHVFVDTVGGGSTRTITITQPTQDLTAPTVTVAVPNGGENWNIGSSHLIAWSQNDNVGVTRDTVLYSTDNGVSWNYLWSGLNTSYNWSVPSAPSALALVKVIARDGDGNRSEDQSDAAFSIRDAQAPTVTVSTPNGGETVYTGSSYTIYWTQSDNIGVAVDSIYYSADGGASWLPVYGGIASSSFNWSVPNTPGASCLVKVVAIDASGNKSFDVSNASFAIVDNVAPTVTLTAPNGGENWYAGAVKNITWNQGDNVAIGRDSLWYSADSGTTWTPIAEVNPAAVSYAWTVPSAVSGRCLVQVKALDAAGNSATDASNAKFAISMPDTQKPRLHAVNADTMTMVAGNAYAVKIYANDNIGVGRVKMYWGTAGSAAVDSNDMTKQADTSYLQLVSGSTVTARGLQYRFVASDSSGNTTAYPASGYFIHTVSSLRLAQSQPFVYDKWQMVSFPALTTASAFTLLRDELGSYDRAKWRLYDYNNGYAEYGTGGFRTNTPGRAFWLRQRVGLSVTVDVDSTTSVAPSGGAVSVPLANGWTDVGDPYLFSVKWSDIRAATGADTAVIQAVYTYDGSAWVLVAPGSNLVAWQGYSVRASGTGTLRIPAIEATKNAAKGDGLWPAGWVGTITVSSGQFRDDNFFGIGEGASTALDRYDYPEPPSGLTGVSGYFTIGDGQYASDLRPALGAGQAWAFAAASQTGANRITVQPPANLPKGAKIFLADLSDQLTQEVTAGGQYEYQAAAANEKRGFKLVVGSDAFAQAEIEKAFTAPAVTLLAQNRPNPVSGKTIISYQLAVPGKVELAVYNIVGQKVRTLVNAAHKAGRYRITWDGGGEDGKRLSNGVYFYRLSAADAVQTRKLTIVR